mmetsp:Transcript_26232/g.62022  ORF Transcript_26232/g.62022 Transcript_26232/m.62022 type:complete len:200 (+) Transcript_26232:713-1312(+)
MRHGRWAAAAVHRPMRQGSPALPEQPSAGGHTRQSETGPASGCRPAGWGWPAPVGRPARHRSGAKPGRRAGRRTRPRGRAGAAAACPAPARAGAARRAWAGRPKCRRPGAPWAPWRHRAPARAGSRRSGRSVRPAPARRRRPRSMSDPGRRASAAPRRGLVPVPAPGLTPSAPTGPACPPHASGHPLWRQPRSSTGGGS